VACKACCIFERVDEALSRYNMATLGGLEPMHCGVRNYTGGICIKSPPEPHGWVLYNYW
jgi:hypothetical protein